MNNRIDEAAKAVKKLHEQAKNQPANVKATGLGKLLKSKLSKMFGEK